MSGLQELLDVDVFIVVAEPVSLLLRWQAADVVSLFGVKKLSFSKREIVVFTASANLFVALCDLAKVYEMLERRLDRVLRELSATARGHYRLREVTP